MINKKIKFCMFFLIGIFLISFASAYLSSDPKLIQSDSRESFGNFDKSMCEAGQDFVVQIAPFGCTPSVVRSDLLEEQDIPVFCQLGATKINPLIDVEAIEGIKFTGELPKEVQGPVRFHPAKSALGVGDNLNSPVLNNIGYAVIVLKKQKNASAFANCEKSDFGGDVCWIQGNLTTELRYDVENAFGIGRATFYLPEMSDEDWENKHVQYGFWNGRFYLRTEGVDENGAKISIYDDTKKLSSAEIRKGGESKMIYLPGFDCLAGLKLKLDGLKAPTTRAKLNINGEIVEIADNEWFLENRCQIKNIGKQGLVQEVSINCKEDEARETFELRINPKVNLTICETDGTNCKTKDYSVGDILYKDEASTNRNVFLGYLGEKKDGNIFIIPAITQHHTPEDFLNSIDMELIEKFAKIEENLVRDKSFIDYLKKDYAVMVAVGNAIIRGSDFGSPIALGAKKEIKFPVGEIAGVFRSNLTVPAYTKKLITFNNFAGARDEFDNINIACVSGDEFEPSACEVGDKIGIMFLESSSEITKQKYNVWNESKSNISYEDKDIKDLFNKNKIFDYTIGGKIYADFSDVLEDKKQQEQTSNEMWENYQNAIKDYDEILNSFADEKYPENSKISLGEEALVEKIKLAWEMGQRKTVVEFCKKFKKDYPDSNKVKEQCENELKLSSSEIDSRDVIINGQVKRISLEDITQPTFEDYGAKIRLTGTNNGGFDGDFELEMNERVLLSEEEWFELRKVEDDYIEIYANVNRGGVIEGFVGVKQETYRIKLNEYEPIGEKNQYQITLMDINLKKQAKVSVIPNVNNVGTSTDFKFKIGVEQRAIKLSPEKTREKIESLDKKIAGWEDKSEKLGKVVKGLKTACLGVGGYLTMKNFFANTGGKSIARQNVMHDIWYSRCKDLVEKDPTNYPKLDSCLMQKADDIERDVNALHKIMETKNDEYKELQKGFETTSWLGTTIDDEELVKEIFTTEYRDGLISTLESNYGEHVEISGQQVPVSDVIEMIDKNMPVTFFRDLEVMTESSKIPSLREMARTQLDKELIIIYVNEKERVEKESFAKNVGAGEEHVTMSSSRNLKEIKLTNYLKFKDLEQTYTVDPLDLIIDPDSNVHFYKDMEESGNNYLIVFDNSGAVIQTYKIQLANVLTIYKGTEEQNNQNPFGFVFKKYDSSSYENRYENAELRYFETEPYKGLPGIVPFDLEEGWYASISQTLPILGNTRSYDDSGRVVSFWVCNVGANNREENRAGDDVCQLINTLANQPDVFSGLTATKARAIINEANKAIERVSKLKNPTGYVYVSPKAKRVKVGRPMADVPEMQCQDFMSPKDCQLLFNVCDPVICPSSRCDFGGSYPVKDVIQSGIIGSLALCAPNFVGFGGDVYVPVCLSGVKAGIDGLVSVYTSYRDCLQHSLETGEQIGVCDEIHSIYLCEFFWRQSLPLAKMIIPKIIEIVLQQNVRGGGEYLGVASAWENAGNSMNYFTQHYAESSYKAFKARSAEEVGGEVCKNFASVIYPQGGNLLDALTESDSPSQFHGRFDEIPFTSATVPPISHYKVFYHIFAGKDSGAYYKVYLKGGADSSFYEDTSYRKMVASGYIGSGDYATNTSDFTAPAGYKEMCIMVNEQEACGFKQVSTSYAVNYVKDQYLAQESERKDIKTEKECISGSVSAYSLLNPNFQEGAGDLISPEIYNQGITRICSTNNPGIGTDSHAEAEGSRWVQVGYCGDEQIKCWLDTQSVENAIRDIDTEQGVLESQSENHLERLKSEGNYIQDFSEELDKIDKEGDSNKKIGLVNKIIDKAFYSYEKAKLFLLRGMAYGELAIEEKKELDKKKTPKPPKDNGAGKDGDGATDKTWGVVIEQGYESPVFEFKDGKILRGNERYSFFGGGWVVSLDSGRWVLVEELENYMEKNDWEISENDKFSLTLKEISYKEGLEKLMQRTKTTKGGWFGSPTLSVDNKIDFSNKGIFTLSPDDADPLYFKHESDNWFWSLNRKVWLNVREDFLDKNEFDLISSLEGMDFGYGAMLIFDGELEVSEIKISSIETGGNCQQIIGNKIRKIIENEKIKKRYNINDEQVKEDTGAESFECLVLQVAMQESSLRHCKNGKEGESCLDCEENLNNILSGDDGDSVGTMQINTKVHKDVNVEKFEDNIKYGVNLLIENYNPSTKSYSCLGKNYAGWQRALRFYNGWNTDCSKGNINYVEEVLNKKGIIISLFPECGEAKKGDKDILDEISGPTEVIIDERYKSPVLKLEEDLVKTDLYYKYSYNKWWWTPFPTESWMPTSTLVLDSSISNQFRKLTEENREFINSLKYMPYQKGLNLLLYRTKTPKEGLDLQPELSAGDVSFSHEGIFTVSRSNGIRIHFLYENDKWWWTPYDPLDGLMRPTPETIFVSGELAKSGRYEGYEPIKENQDLIKSLNGLDFIDGAMIIFDRRLGASEIVEEEIEAIEELRNAISKAMNSRAGDLDSKKADKWAEVIIKAMEENEITLDKKYASLIVSTIERESSFRIDPVVPNVEEMVLRKIEEIENQGFLDKWGGAKTIGAKWFYEKYMDEIKGLQTEKQLHDFLDRVGYIEGFFVNEFRPTTIGSMQLNIDKAKSLAKKYYYQAYSDKEMRNILFTLNGGVKYGVLYLSEIINAYTNSQKNPLTDEAVKLIAADYQSGLYTSRNAALQSQLNELMGRDLGLGLDLDGDIGPKTLEEIKYFLEREEKEDLFNEDLIISIEKEKDFEESAVYKLIKEKYKSSFLKEPEYAIIPKNVIEGAKWGFSISTERYTEGTYTRYKEYCEALKC